MKNQNAFSKKAIILAGAGLLLLSACDQTGPTAAGNGPAKASIESPASMSALTAMAQARASAGDTVAIAQLAKLRALAEAGITSGPELDAAIAEIRAALGDGDVVVIGPVERVDAVDPAVDPKVKADMDALRALIEAGKTGPEVDAAIEKLNVSTGGKDVVIMGDVTRCETFVDLSGNAAVTAASEKVKALIAAGDRGDDFKAAMAELRAARAAAVGTALDGESTCRAND